TFLVADRPFEARLQRNGVLIHVLRKARDAGLHPEDLESIEAGQLEGERLSGVNHFLEGAAQVVSRKQDVDSPVCAELSSDQPSWTRIDLDGHEAIRDGEGRVVSKRRGDDAVDLRAERSQQSKLPARVGDADVL